MRYVKIACLVFLLLFLVSSFLGEGLPAASDIDPRIFAPPVQERVQMAPFTVRSEDVDYTITPLYSYDLHGLVVSCHDSDGLFDYYHKLWGDTLNVKDLCVLWGSNVQTDIYTKLNYSSGSYTCYVSTPDSDIWRRFDTSELSNNHLLTDDPAIAAALRDTAVGDQVRIRGYLSQYSHGQGFERGTSISRTDTGNGACETIFITGYDVLSRYGGPWRAIRSASLLGFAATFLTLAGWFVYGLFRPESLADVDKFVERAAKRAEKGDMRGALALLNKAVDRNPDRGDIFTARAAVHSALGDYHAADMDTARAAALDEPQPLTRQPSLMHRDPSTAQPQSIDDEPSGSWGPAAPPPPPRRHTAHRPAHTPAQKAPRQADHAGFRPPWLDGDES